MVSLPQLEADNGGVITTIDLPVRPSNLNSDSGEPLTYLRLITFKCCDP